MVDYMIPLVASWLPLWYAYLVPIFALSFVAWVGSFLHSLLRR